MTAPRLNDLTDAISEHMAEHGGADEVQYRIAMAALVGAIWNVVDAWPEPRGAKILDACRRALLDTVPADRRDEPTVH